MADSTRTGFGFTARRAQAQAWLRFSLIALALGAVSAGCGSDAGSGDAPGSAGSVARGGDAAGGARAGDAGQTSQGAAGAAGDGRTPAAEAGAAGSVAGEAGAGAGGSLGGDASAGAGAGGSVAGDAGTGGEAGEATLRVVNWSIRKQLVTPEGEIGVLEETLRSFLEAETAPTRLRLLTPKGEPRALWTPPAGSYIADFTRHPQGDFSAVLIADDRSVSVVRLAADLKQLALTRINDPEAAHDPHASEAGVTDLVSNGLALDPARIAALGETALVAVVSNVNAVIAYRIPFVAGGFAVPARTLVEPPAGITPFLPIGGSFDTFGALGAWFRCPLDVDEDGNAYVAVWAAPGRIRAHVALFHDGLVQGPIEPGFSFTGDSDLLLTKLDAEGARQWTRVVGSIHEDEPYALRAREGLVAVVGRSRRFVGNDNTAWDALVSVSRANGELVGTRTFAQNDSSILLAVDRVPGRGWLLGGSDGWAQNPEGLSILQFGTKLLFRLDSDDLQGATETALIRYPVEPGPRHNEIRSVLALGNRLWFAGHEDGPIMHTGDGDLSQIHATGVLGSVAR